MTVEQWLQAIERREEQIRERDERIRDLEWQVETLRGMLRAKGTAERIAPVFACNVDESAGMAEIRDLHSVRV